MACRSTCRRRSTEPVTHSLPIRWLLALTWLVLGLGGATLLARSELVSLREAFETDARISHRLLSQQAVQHDAVLATLALLQPQARAPGDARVEQRLSSLYPQIVDVQRRDAGAQWSQSGLAQAEAASQATRRPVLANLDFAARPARYHLVLDGVPSSFAIAIDVRTAIPWAEWSMPVESSPVRVSLQHAGQEWVIQPGSAQARTDATALGSGWRFEFHKHLASDSQAFDVVAVRQVGWSELPWALMLVWLVATTLVLAGVAAWQRQRTARRRAEELLRFGQVARLNTLGELAAGMAHELSQPLTAVLANTQAARRLLQGDAEEQAQDLPRALQAMEQAAAQARRASDVLGRLRRTVEQPGALGTQVPVRLEDAVQSVLYLLEPDCRKRQVQVSLQSDAAVQVQADPVALEQIVHNLLMNALQALDEVAPDARQLRMGIGTEGQMGVLRVSDSGPGLPADILPRVFEPFFTTRHGGLGLGLSLCETLATSMGGRLQALPGGVTEGRGATFVLTLPRAQGEAGALHG